MKHKTLTLSLLLGLLAGVGSEEIASDFPSFSDVREPLLLAPRPVCSVDPDGNWLVNGKIRYLLGTQVPSLFGRGAYGKIPGLNGKYSWVAEHAPDYQICQRVGFDTLCFENPMSYMKDLFPQFRYNLIQQSGDGFALEPGLPVLVDYTCAPWSNGRAGNFKGDPFFMPELQNALPREALVPSSDQVWVPYSVFHPAARNVYKAMWRSGAEIARKYRVPVLAYELFNEPMYHDRTAYARTCFVEVLKKKYGTPEAMNRNWKSSYKSFQEAAMRPNLKENTGLFVDYLKFLEEGVVDICRFGGDSIREIDPSARFCIQLKGLWHYRTIIHSSMNLYKLNRMMDVVTVSTSGGIGLFEGVGQRPEKSVDAPSNPIALFDGVMERHFYRALADGKPMQNQEMYVGNTYDTILSRLWLDVCRGSAATYIFNWSSGYPLWKTKDEAGARRSAETAGYTMLNPYAVNPDALPAIWQAKKEIFRFGEFFVPRRRNVKREVAVLFSYPTERASGASGFSLKREFVTYGGALEFSHYPIDVLFEEQLPENRQSRYRAIVAGGVGNVYPETVPALLNFVKKGGVLLLGREFLSKDEYEHPSTGWNGFLDGLTYTDDFNAPLSKIRPDIPQPENLTGALTVRTTRRITQAPGWDVLAKDGKYPVLLRKKLGEGTVYLLTAEMPDYSLASLLGSVLNRHGIVPEVRLSYSDRRELPTNVEIHTAYRGDRAMHFLYNADSYPKLVRMDSEFLKKHPFAYDMTGMTRLPIGKDGLLFLLKPRMRALIGIGPENAFREFGTFSGKSEKEMISDYEKLSLDISRKLLEKEQNKFRYHPNPARTYCLNLNDLANSGFADTTIPGDGKGGWTDQGRGSSLNGVPWGQRNFLGVPCELIRYDQNENRTCIVLKSKSSKIPNPERVSIPVNDTLKALYFFHTAAWVPAGKKVKAMDYVIEYASGKTLEVPVVTNGNIWDWYSIRDPKRVETAWKNMDSHGFFCWRWENPRPEDAIRSIVLRSANGVVIPIVIAVTAERFDPQNDPKSYYPARLKTYSYGGLKALDDKDFHGTSAGGKTSQFAGFVITASPFYYPIQAKNAEKAVLKFEIRGGLDKFNIRRSGQKFELSLNVCGSNGVNLFRSKRVRLDRYLKTIGKKFQSVEIPVSVFFADGKYPEKNCNQLGFRAWGGVPESGIELRNIHFEIPVK